MFRLPPLNALKTFEAAARHASFSKAAEELHVTQSAVSHQIRQLEGWFGISLFDRQGRQTNPTPEGRELAASLEESLGQISAACQRIAKSDGRTTLTIASIPSVATIWLIPRLPAFLASHPGINIRLIHAYHDQPVDFADVDLAITYGDWRDAPSGAVKLMSGASVPVCSPLYLDQHGPFETPADLLRTSLLHDEDRKGWRSWFKAAGIKARDTLPGPLFEGFNLLHSAILAGQGVGLAPRLLLRRDIEAGRLISLFDLEILHERAYYMTSPQIPRPSRTAETETVRAWLLRETAD
jgi:DNA-binding transcriptional LysR family regulator